MEKDKFKILIVGNGAAASALTKKISQYEYVEKIFSTGGISDCVEIIDIREDDLTGLLMFAWENKIDLTIPISPKALEADIVSFFQSNGQNIFGPSRESCNFIFNNISCKKFLYKLHASVAKFGMYNKLSQIGDYLKNSAYPVLLKSAQNTASEDEKMICTTYKNAMDFADKLFLKGEIDVLIEDFVMGHNFTIYFVTDGYSAIPLNIVGNYKFLDKNGGIYTDGCACYCPDYKISNTIIDEVKKIVTNILNCLDNDGKPYTGILGINCVLTKNENFLIQDIKPFLQNHDARAVLNLCEDDLIKIFISCINGFFSDEYEQIKTNDCSSVAVCVYSDLDNSEISGLEDIEDVDFINIKKDNEKYYSQIGMNFTLTKTAMTLSRAKKYLSEEIEDIKFAGMKYRKDIYDKIEQ